MGGRRSYPTKNLLGNSKGVKKSFSTLKDVLENDRVKDVGNKVFKVFLEAKKPIDYSSYSSKLGIVLIKNYSKWKEEADDNKLRRKIIKSWSEIKIKNKISIPKEIDRLIVEQALKSLRGGRHG